MDSKKTEECGSSGVLQVLSYEGSAGSDFLWVDGAPSDPAIRTKIRSHVRKDGLKKLKESRKNARLPRYPSLKSAISLEKPTARSNGSSPSFNRPRLTETDCAEDDESQRTTQTHLKDSSSQYSIEPACRNWKEEKSLVKRERSWNLPISPIEVLGAGRVDPFSCYCVNNPKPFVNEFLDHGVHYVLPGFVPEDNSPYSTSYSITKVWFNLAIASPILFHALVYSGAVHRDFLRWTNIFPNSLQALPHKIYVIRQLNKILADPKQACGNEVLASILILAAHEKMITPTGERNPFHSPLTSAQWINVYGHIRYAPVHMNALLNLVALRGGLENIDTGLAEIIAFADMVSATNSIAKPVYQPLKRTKSWIASLHIWAASPPRPPILTQAVGFENLDYGILTSEMLEAFHTIGALTIAIEYYLRGEFGGLKLGDLARVRTPIQGMLLSLPSATELKQSDTTRPLIYECCRITGLIYGIAVVLPVPNSSSLLQELVTSLRGSLEALENENCESDQKVDPKLLLWVLVLGGIAALDKPERPWFVSQLASLLEVAPGYLAWQSVEKVLATFLWLDSACSTGGRVLWSEVLAKHAYSTGTI